MAICYHGLCGLLFINFWTQCGVVAIGFTLFIRSLPMRLHIATRYIRVLLSAISRVTLGRGFARFANRKYHPLSGARRSPVSNQLTRTVGGVAGWLRPCLLERLTAR